MWCYKQPIAIYFGCGERARLKELIQNVGYTKGLLVCDSFLAGNGTAQQLMDCCGSLLPALFCDIRPNPTVVNVDDCARALKELHADFVVALGGGSVMDCAKAAATMALAEGSITQYHATGVPLPSAHLPLISIPTTAGTGAEVTCSCVLSDEAKGIKAPLLHDNFYSAIAIIDPELTYTVPPRICAGTGLDVLAHAVEGYMSVNHQPVCDAICVHAARLVLENIEAACGADLDIAAKSAMAEASVMAGMGFSIPKTGASHACSFVLTNKYHIPHGEACGLTLDYFMSFNARSDDPRMQEFAHLLGFDSCEELCRRIAEIKVHIGARTNLKDLALSDEDIGFLVKNSHHPNLKNNPVEITDKTLYDLYTSLR